MQGGAAGPILGSAALGCASSFVLPCRWPAGWAVHSLTRRCFAFFARPSSAGPRGFVREGELICDLQLNGRMVGGEERREVEGRRGVFDSLTTNYLEVRLAVGSLGDCC